MSANSTNPKHLTREALRDLLARRLRAEPWCLAAWEGGSAAFKRADEWSDLDLCVIVEDARVADAFAAVEAELRALGPISDQYNVPEPAWHGHSQRFYRLQGAPPWLMLDLAVQKRSNGNRLLEPARHGEAGVLFDKEGLLTFPALDAEAHGAAVRRRREQIVASFPMFQELVRKEIRRDKPVDAMAFYFSQTLKPLADLASITYRPERFDYGFRYTKTELPRAVHDRLAKLMYVANLADLATKHDDAVAFYDELVKTPLRSPR